MNTIFSHLSVHNKIPDCDFSILIAMLYTVNNKLTNKQTII